MSNETYIHWLKEHLQGAIARYKELCELDEAEIAAGGTDSEHYVQAQQMFGYVAALEKCVKEAERTLGKKSTKH